MFRLSSTREHGEQQLNEDRETETVGSTAETATAGEGDQEGQTSEPWGSEKVSQRIAQLRQRGVEVDEWLAEEFTNIERALRQLRDARLRGRQPVVWFQTAKDVTDAFDRGILKDKNEARKMFGLPPLRKRAQPAHLAAAQAARHNARHD